jgi:integrative and conjugative element protein (TIGR02256 family)
MEPSPESSASHAPDRMPGLRLSTPDGRYGLEVGRETLDAIVALCAGADRVETGGILAGRYTEALDYAIVTDVLGPPSDSRAGRDWFERGVEGVQPWLEALWDNGQRHYLGEWHFHPAMSARPSRRDLRQMREFSSAPLVRCPAPVLLVIGGELTGAWEAQAFVVPCGGPTVPLLANRRLPPPE